MSPPHNQPAPTRRIDLRHGLTFRQAAITLIIVLLLGTLAGLIELYADWRAMRGEIQGQAQTTLGLVSGSAEEAMFQYNEVLAEQVVDSLLETGQIRHVVLEDNFGEIFASGQRQRHQEGSGLIDYLFGDLADYRHSLRYQTNDQTVHEVGYLAISLATGEIAENFLQRGTVILLLGLIKALIISALVVLIFYGMITRPLLQLYASISHIDPRRPGEWPRPALKGHDQDELGQIKRSLEELMQAFQRGLEQRDQAQEENARLGAELEISRRIQQILLPPQAELDVIDSLEMAAFMEPADEVGGDYYDVLQHPGGVRIGIGDVTGHGLESGVVMLMTQSAVRTLLNTTEEDIVRTMQVLNATIYGNVQRMGCGKNLSLALLDYQAAPPQTEADQPRGYLRTYGQHESIIIVRRDGELETLDTDSLGFPIGLIDDVSQFINEFKVELHQGDTVVLYTDGVTEAANEAQQLYGSEQLIRIISQHHQESAARIRDHIVSDVKRHIGKQVVYDDITLLVFKQR